MNSGRGAYGTIVAGEGVHFVLDDGRRIVDASNTGGPLGHGHPEVVAAVREAAVAPVISEGWLWPEREHAARELIETAFADELGWIGGVRFVLSGSEANDLALSLAQVLTGRSTVATRERAYHGMNGLARAVTVQPHWHGGLSSEVGEVRPAPPATKVVRIPAPDGARIRGNRQPQSATDLLANASELLADSAAVVVDYSQGGVYHTVEYQDAVAEAARSVGALWIADEVVTGFGRQFGWFAFQEGSSRPDIVTLGKPLAGGASPAGAVVVSQAIMDELKSQSWQTYSTFRGHPLTMAAVRAHLRVLVREGLVGRARELDGVMRDNLARVVAEHPSVCRVDGRGLHWTVELNGVDWRTWSGNAASDPLATRVAARAAQAGALIGTSGEPSSLFLAPPLIISDEELQTVFSALDEGLSVADEALA
ncbi:MAG TPA: aminotransferase class III-fold pyridoxal phosphate-dependent enzyme [Solirubrobacteraceae bacterium]